MVIAIFIGIVLLIGWFLVRPKKKDNVSTGAIHIVIDNRQGKKEVSTKHSDIITEAEAMFKALKQKYLYSPIPFKVLGDFYASKGLIDQALEKYTEMVRYLNKDLSIEKLNEVIIFLKRNGQEDLTEKIVSHYR